MVTVAQPADGAREVLQFTILAGFLLRSQGRCGCVPGLGGLGDVPLVKLSILMPAYNECDTILQAVEEILGKLTTRAPLSSWL